MNNDWNTESQKAEAVITDWRLAILNMSHVKQELFQVDKQKLWPWHLPEVAATQEQLDTLEVNIGYSLDAKYKSFLSYANGWKGFYHEVDLFGIEDLQGSFRMAKAVEMLTAADDALKYSGVELNELLPIAVSITDMDVFVIVRSTHAHSGEIIWFAGGEIDRFKDFDEYFLSMIEYNRRAIRRILGRSS
jgi:hypothetical protein